MKKRLEIACLTDVGLVRKHNEDCVATDSRIGVAILADGMGGYQAGEIASEIAVTQILHELRTNIAITKLPEVNPKNGYSQASILLYNSIEIANDEIFSCAKENSDFHGMGTTIVAMLFYDDFVSIAHVGDSRIYRYRHNNLQQITKDHSVLQELIDHGFYTEEEARSSPNRNLVTRALGVIDDLEIDVQELPIQPQDVYLLCSDGLSDMLTNYEINNILGLFSNNLNKTAKQLIKAANDKGGDDNISVILIQVLDKPKNTNWLYKMFGYD
jgi:protein phosphatase